MNIDYEVRRTEELLDRRGLSDVRIIHDPSGGAILLVGDEQRSTQAHGIVTNHCRSYFLGQRILTLRAQALSSRERSCSRAQARQICRERSHSRAQARQICGTTRRVAGLPSLYTASTHGGEGSLMLSALHPLIGGPLSAEAKPPPEWLGMPILRFATGDHLGRVVRYAAHADLAVTQLDSDSVRANNVGQRPVSGIRNLADPAVFTEIANNSQILRLAGFGERPGDRRRAQHHTTCPILLGVNLTPSVNISLGSSPSRLTVGGLALIRNRGGCNRRAIPLLFGESGALLAVTSRSKRGAGEVDALGVLIGRDPNYLEYGWVAPIYPYLADLGLLFPPGAIEGPPLPAAQQTDSEVRPNR